MAKPYQREWNREEPGPSRTGDVPIVKRWADMTELERAHVIKESSPPDMDKRRMQRKRRKWRW